MRIVGALARFGVTSTTGQGIHALAARAATAAEPCGPELRSSVLALAAYYEINQGRVERAPDLVNPADFGMA